MPPKPNIRSAGQGKTVEPDNNRPSRPTPARGLASSLKRFAVTSLGLGVLGTAGYSFIVTPEEAPRVMTASLSGMTEASVREKATTVRHGATTLMPGSTDVPRIIAMQEDILTLGLGLDACGANGIFGKDEMKAVNAFRKASGVTHEAEYVDASDLQRLYESAERQRNLSDSFTAPGTARKKMKEKEDMRLVQADLIAAGYPVGVCGLSGQPDEGTTAAVERFQRDHRIYPASGMLDEKTRGAIHFRASAAREKLDRPAAVVVSIPAAAPVVVPPTNLARKPERLREDTMTTSLYGGQMLPEQLRASAMSYIKNRNVPEYIVEAAVEAGQKTGMDLTYLLDIGAVESSHRPWAAAKTSSAVGPWQFTDDVWLKVFRRNGEKYGYSTLIGRMDKDKDAYQYVLDLRKDPKISAIMAGELALENKRNLEKLVNVSVTKTNLYEAHLLGVSDGARFINLYHSNPNTIAARHFPMAASRNWRLFFDDHARPRTVADIHKNFLAQMNGDALRPVAARKARRVTENNF